MKLKSPQIKTLASKIQKEFKGFLIYGPDTGAVKETAQAVIDLLNPPKDPYAVVSITSDRLKETPTLFWDEVNAISMFGGRRIIWFKNPTDAFTAEWETFLKTAQSDTFVVMTSDTLNTKSKLVKACDDADWAGCVACYPETEQDTKQTILSTLSAAGYLIDPDALALFASYLGADKAVTRSEINKLMIYLGAQKQVHVSDIQANIGNGASVTIDDLIYAAFSGNHSQVQRVYAILLQEGSQPVMMVRSLINKADQLMIVLSKMKRGEPVDAAIKGTYPFIPFQYAPTWKKIVMGWNEAAAADALALLLQAERDCKSGLPAEVILNRTLTSLTAAGRKFMNARPF